MTDTHIRRMARALFLVSLLGSAALLAACADLGYYAHVTHGETSLLMSRRPVGTVIADPKTDPGLAQRLRLSQQARTFASNSLKLPSNRSYTYYVALNRAYVVWNVYATPRFSLDPIEHCFPVAGCVAYRGWFDQVKARNNAEHLQAQGYDVYVGGVPAYSTLGWFADPIISSMLRWDDDELVGTIFHELAHQLIYVKGDTAFNESYAMFVENEGVREWHRSRNEPVDTQDNQAMDDSFTELVLQLRDKLNVVYTSSAKEPVMTMAKQKEIEAFRARYTVWRDQQWHGDHRYDRWVAEPINNASLLPFGLYDQWTPAFAALFQRANGNWPAFYDRVRAMAAEPPAQRKGALEALMKDPVGHAASMAPTAP